MEAPIKGGHDLHSCRANDKDDDDDDDEITNE
jgi:hypothetical protein